MYCLGVKTTGRFPGHTLKRCESTRLSRLESENFVTHRCLEDGCGWVWTGRKDLEPELIEKMMAPPPPPKEKSDGDTFPQR